MTKKYQKIFIYTMIKWKILKIYKKSIINNMGILMNAVIYF